jgi:AraC-like DNA-binding protein
MRWKMLIADMGFSPADVLALARLPGDLFARPDATLSPAEYFNLWHGMEQVAGVDELPLKLAMWEAFEPSLRQRLSVLDEQASTADRVRGVLLETLPAGLSSVDAVAQRLAMSKRSLQRHLGDEAVNFQDVLNRVRQELAQHYLINSSISPGEISWLLGFQESNSFIRAFRSWTGTTPLAYRMGHAPRLH